MTDLAVLEAAREALGFQLTGGQEQALDNVLRDLEGPAPMMCLLQVGLPLLSADPSTCVSSYFTLADLRSGAGVLGLVIGIHGHPHASSSLLWIYRLAPRRTPETSAPNL